MTCGIYCIQNTINQKKYIGLSTNIERRLKDHLISLRNKNTEKENEHFIRSFHKYGEDAFQARIIIVCDQNILAPMEQYLIKIFKTYNPKFGYNKTLGGERNQPTIETRKKMSESHKGKKPSEGTKKKLSESLKGRKHSDETKKKISEYRKGKKLSDETKKKMSEYRKGKKLSDETKKKISESLKGRKHSDEAKKKISKSKKGKYIGENNPFYEKKHSIESRKKISESRKGKCIGENNPNYNHNVPNGLELLEEKKQGIKITDLAIKYNCSRQTIRNRINKVL